MMLSAGCFYAAVRRFEGRGLWIAMGAAFMFPMTHYIAVVAVVYAMMVYMVVGQKWYDGRLLLVGGSATMGVVISAIVFAIPQYLRIDRLWFFTMDMSSWPSSLLFGFFYPLGSGILPVIVYIGFLILLCILGYSAFNLVVKLIDGKADDQERILLLMGSVAIVTAVGIELSKIVPVYHHRFFLVILWMFAAMVFVLFWRWVYGWWDDYDSWKTGWLLFAVPAMIVVFAVLGGMFVQYATHQQRELERIEASIPCAGDRVVVAEELWSGLPLRVYARENGCAWHVLMSTNLTKRQVNSQGYDVIIAEDIYWNRSFPNQAFWFAYGSSCENDSECLGLFENRTSTIVRKDVGISLIYVGARQ
jgi:MFS family permease